MRLFRIALGLILTSSVAEAQVFASRPPRALDQWIIGITAFPAFPVGDFRQDQKFGAGLDLNVGYQPFRREMTVIRANFGFLQYDSYNRNESAEICDFFGNNCSNETIFYDSQNHSTSFIHGGPEFMVTAGKWRPFVYGVGGVTFFHSTARFGDAFNSSSGTRTLFVSSNVSSAYGLGVRRVAGRDGRQHGWELGVRFTRNAKAEYLTKEGVYRDSFGNYAVSPKTGQANFITVHIGYSGGPRVNWNER
jgi:hypothetical protein